MKANEAVLEFLREAGRTGGRAGTGAAKVRSPEHYRRLVEIRRVNREVRNKSGFSEKSCNV